MQRDVRREMDKSKKSLSSTTHAQEVLRIELEKNKITRKAISRAEKEAHAEEKFHKKQEKKKKKHRGH